MFSTSALQGQFGQMIRYASHQPASLCSDQTILLFLFIVFKFSCISKVQTIVQLQFTAI